MKEREYKEGGREGERAEREGEREREGHHTYHDKILSSSGQ